MCGRRWEGCRDGVKITMTPQRHPKSNVEIALGEKNQGKTKGFSEGHHTDERGEGEPRNNKKGEKEQRYWRQQGGARQKEKQERRQIA